MSAREACVIAFGAIGARGIGRAAFEVGAIGAAPRVAIVRDDALARAGLAKPFAARAPGLDHAAGDPATELLQRALRDAIAGLDGVRPGWRDERVGLALGTSSGGMASAEDLFAARRASVEPSREIARSATYFAPLDAAIAELGLTPARVRCVLAACAASTIALGIATRWLDANACDLVLAGGYDAVTRFVAAGFEVLRATSATLPRPFRVGRDGMALGEGAAIVALVRGEDARGAPVSMRVAGFGASTDAVHITAPDRTGGGLARAATAALADAAVDRADVGLVSAHGTATPFNDAMEVRAIAAALGRDVLVHALKAEIGHTLGAAGVLEALAAADALARGVGPATAGAGDLDPDAGARLVERAVPLDASAALKLSAAFGGTNAALVLTREAVTRAARTARAAYVVAAARASEVPSAAEVAALAGIAIERVGRIDALGRLALAAVGKLARRASLDGAGVVAGHALATVDTNERFDAKAAVTPLRADPRLFPATSPNAVAGECAIAFHLTGPGFSVGGGLDGGTEALAAARDLVAAGDASRVVVVVADDAGPAARAILAALRPGAAIAPGAVALLVSADPTERAVAIDPALEPDHARAPVGHLALLSRFFAARSDERDEPFD